MQNFTLDFRLKAEVRCTLPFSARIELTILTPNGTYQCKPFIGKEGLPSQLSGITGQNGKTPVIQVYKTSAKQSKDDKEGQLRFVLTGKK